MSGPDIRIVPIEVLSPDPDQPRKVFDQESLVGLSGTMRDRQLAPILAFEREGGLVIIDGERRWRAAKLAGMKHLHVLVVPQPSRDRALEQSLIANLQREDLSPIEKARAIARLMEATKSTAAKVAVRLGLSPSNVSRLLALLELPEDVQERVDRGDLAASTAYQIARAGLDPVELAAEVAEKGLNRDAVRARRRTEGKGPARPSAGKRGRLVACLGRGRTVTLAGPGLASMDAVVEWLEELLARARKARPRGVEPATFLALLRDEAKAAESSPKDDIQGGA